MRARGFLDTNVLVYAFDAATPIKQQRAQALIQECLTHDSGVVSPQVLSEFFVTVTCKIESPLTVDEAQEIIETLESLVSVDIDYPLVLRAIQAQRDFKIAYWDGMILAAAERAQCQCLWSEDLNPGQTYWKVRVENPFA